MTITNPEYQVTEQGFLSSIAEDPHELANWLIFADFLADHGHPRAEVTRLWATRRFDSIPLNEQEQARLDDLLTMGLRPYLPRHVNTLGMEFVLVPSGTFWMSEDGENAQRQVEIPYNFRMGIYPVTQEQWRIVMGNNPSAYSRTGAGKSRVKRIPDADLRQFPVETVSWDDVQVFLEELNRRENAGSGWLYRLPTEAEWEYACRGGATSGDDCSFHYYLHQPTYDLSSRQANFNGTFPGGHAPIGEHLKRPTRVGSYAPNALGIHDMHGNVWEWCQDSNEEDSVRVIRGGSFDYPAVSCRAALSGRLTPGHRQNDLGFRLALVPSPTNGSLS